MVSELRLSSPQTLTLAAGLLPLPTAGQPYLSLSHHLKTLPYPIPPPTQPSHLQSAASGRRKPPRHPAASLQPNLSKPPKTTISTTPPHNLPPPILPPPISAPNPPLPPPTTRRQPPPPPPPTFSHQPLPTFQNNHFNPLSTTTSSPPLNFTFLMAPPSSQNNQENTSPQNTLKNPTPTQPKYHTNKHPYSFLTTEAFNLKLHDMPLLPNPP